MTQQSVQDKRDGLDLLQGMVDEQTRKAIIRAFQGQLTDYVVALLSPANDDAQALWIRGKAMGVIETLDSMGMKMATVEAVTPIRKGTDELVRQSLGRY